MTLNKGHWSKWRLGHWFEIWSPWHFRMLNDKTVTVLPTSSHKTFVDIRWVAILARDGLQRPQVIGVGSHNFQVLNCLKLVYLKLFCTPPFLCEKFTKKLRVLSDPTCKCEGSTYPIPVINDPRSFSFSDPVVSEWTKAPKPPLKNVRSASMLGHLPHGHSLCFYGHSRCPPQDRRSTRITGSGGNDGFSH